MPDLLFELFCEEIPARMQARAAADLQKLVTDALVEAGLSYEGARAFATPRRLALTVNGLPVSQPDSREERRGPRIDAPDKAIEGFVRAAGLASIEEAQVRSDPKKGDYYLAVIERKGQPTLEFLSTLLPDVIRRFPWPKSMRWGDGELRWVRPLQAIVATFGPETEDPEIVPFEVDGLAASNITYGHRFMAPDPIFVRRLEDYAAKLERARVIIDREQRKQMILTDARNEAFAQGLELIEDEALLEEAAGLVEWPKVMFGSFDESFLELPEEVIVTSIRTHQKCFSLKSRETGRLANRFVLTANIEPKDGGRAVVEGNERVVRARLSDAAFFWQTDLATPLERHAEKLGRIVFHEKLGTQAERVARLEHLAGMIAEAIGADADRARRAARLSKADLVTEMVGEFPELQGLMGRYYAERQGEAAEVAAAIEAHYKPQGPADRVPEAPVSIAVALADKLDLLTGFWAIDEKPTGSKDPYALRRAALGVIRLVLENSLRLRLSNVFAEARILLRQLKPELFEHRMRSGESRHDAVERAYEDVFQADLLSFLHDRLKVHLREEGVRHDVIDGALALEGTDDLYLLASRARSLSAFLKTDEGANLLSGVKRAINILRDEEKKDGVAYEGMPETQWLTEPEEKTLFTALEQADDASHLALERGDYAEALKTLATLRLPVDAFFDRVIVNDENAVVRRNRLCLLHRMRVLSNRFADFTRIEGV